MSSSASLVTATIWIFFQIGCIGLIKAIDNFDLTQNVRFSTYAVPMKMGKKDGGVVFSDLLGFFFLLCYNSAGVFCPGLFFELLWESLYEKVSTAYRMKKDMTAGTEGTTILLFAICRFCMDLRTA